VETLKLEKENFYNKFPCIFKMNENIFSISFLVMKLILMGKYDGEYTKFFEDGFGAFFLLFLFAFLKRIVYFGNFF
jgi:hypothetical protein